MTTETQRLVEAIERARGILFSSVMDLSDAQATLKPSQSEWAIVEILEHLYLAEFGGITKMWAALTEFRAGKHWSMALPHRGKPIEDVIATTWQSREQAPETAIPRFGGPLAAWVAALRRLALLLADLARELEGHNLETIVFPHVISGPLDARQRLEFIRFHIERHTAQIQRIRSQNGFPPFA